MLARPETDAKMRQHRMAAPKSEVVESDLYVKIT